MRFIFFCFCFVYGLFCSTHHEHDEEPSVVPLDGAGAAALVVKVVVRSAALLQRCAQAVHYIHDHPQQRSGAHDAREEPSENDIMMQHSQAQEEHSTVQYASPSCGGYDGVLNSYGTRAGKGGWLGWLMIGLAELLAGLGWTGLDWLTHAWDGVLVVVAYWGGSPHACRIGSSSSSSLQKYALAQKKSIVLSSIGCMSCEKVRKTFRKIEVQIWRLIIG